MKSSRRATSLSLFSSLQAKIIRAVPLAALLLTKVNSKRANSQKGSWHAGKDSEPLEWSVLTRWILMSFGVEINCILEL